MRYPCILYCSYDCQGGGGDKKEEEEDKKPKQTAQGKALAERMARQREEEERFRKLEASRSILATIMTVMTAHTLRLRGDRTMMRHRRTETKSCLYGHSLMRNEENLCIWAMSCRRRQA